jgi:DNA-binding IclR family transcriptional regulator
MPAGAAEIGGAQSIGRALQVIKYVASQPSGARLKDVVAACDLNKATAHRILAALVADGFLRVPGGSNLYELGREALIIGWAARARQDLRELAQRSLSRLCSATGDTVFLSVRSGSDAVCVDRHVGDFPIKTLTLEVGSRRPLGVGSGSLALLSFLPTDEIEDELAAVAPRLAAYPLLSPTRLRELIRETRAQGYSFNNEGVIAGMSALGVPIFGGDTRPVAALSVAAIPPRMGDDRRPEIVAALMREADDLGGRLRAGGAGAPQLE